MADLSTTFTGIKFPNPFMLASAPPTESESNIRRAYDAGWGGVVTKTIGLHQVTNVRGPKTASLDELSAVVKDLMRRGKEADVQFENLHSATRDGHSDMLVLKYSYVPEPNGERQPLWIYINRRYDDGSKRFQWDVGGIQNTPPFGSSE